MALAVGIAALAMLFELGVCGRAGDGAPDAPTGTPIQLTVTVRAPLDSANLGWARETVDALLATGGLRAEWHDCPAGSACATSPGASRTISVLLVPFADPAGSELGGKVTRDPRTRAPSIVVYVKPIADLARGIRFSAAGRSNPRLATVQTGHLVGLTIAHEVGHALELRHAASGLMQPHIDIEDVLALQDARLAFTPAEAARMRLEVGLDATVPCENTMARRRTRHGPARAGHYAQ